MTTLYKNKHLYLTLSFMAYFIALVSGILVFFRFVKFSAVYCYLYFLFGVFCIQGLRICIKESTSLLIVDDNGVKTQNSLRNVTMNWNQIVRIEYCGSQFTLNERIVIHSENDKKIFVSIHRKKYLEAFQVITSECLKHNSNVLIDKTLLKRLNTPN